MHCGFCGAAIPEGSQFCPSCGKRTQPEAQRTCGNCGEPLRPGLKFCTSCGTAVGSVPFQPPMSAPTPVPTAGPQQRLYDTHGQLSPKEERGKRGIPPLLFWIPFGILLLLATLLFWIGKTSLVGWAILVICFLLPFILREMFLMAGVLTNAAGWVTIAAALFLTLGLTASSKEAAVASTGSKSTRTSEAAAPSSTPPASATAVSKSNATTSATPPTARPTPAVLKMDPPPQLKPLILSGPKPTDRVQYQLYLDGDSSNAFLNYQISGGTKSLSNWMGDTNWLVTIYFELTEDRAKRNLQSQLKTSREDQGFKDDIGVFMPRVESSLGKGDESYGFTRAWKDQPQAAMSTFIVRQGASWFYISTIRDTKDPVLPGDGIDLLLGELKRIDNKTLITAAQGGAVAAPALPIAAPNPTPVPSAQARVEKMAVGLGPTA